jgi:hypothetical protein
LRRRDDECPMSNYDPFGFAHRKVMLALEEKG